MRFGPPRRDRIRQDRPTVRPARVESEMKNSKNSPPATQPAKKKLNKKPDRAPGGPPSAATIAASQTGRVSPYIQANLTYADPDEALPSSDGTVSKPDWLLQIRSKLQLRDIPGQVPTSEDLVTLDLLIDAVDKDIPALTTLRDLWRFCVKTLSLPVNMNQTYPNPSRLALVMISTAKITSGVGAH